MSEIVIYELLKYEIIDVFKYSITSESIKKAALNLGTAYLKNICNITKSQIEAYNCLTIV